MAIDDRWHDRRSRDPRYDREDFRNREGFWGSGHDDDGFHDRGSRHYSREDYGATGRGPEHGAGRPYGDAAGEFGRVHQGGGGGGRRFGGIAPDDRYGRVPADSERGFFERASDEVASWFGDTAAERRREMDHRGRGPKGYRRSDARIQDDVSDRLADDRHVDASEIEVSVNGGEVTLAGTVDNRDARRRAEDLAEQVSGVTYVQNNLRVQQANVGFARKMEAARSESGQAAGGTFGTAALGERPGANGDMPRPPN